VVLLGTTAASAPASDTQSAGTTLHFNVNFSPFYLDLGARGPSMGDQIVAHDVLLDSAGRQVGHNAVSCIITDPSGGSEAECTATFALPRGQIATQFLNTPPAVKTFAVTGGTGAYKTARGEAVLVENGDGTGTVTHGQRREAAPHAVPPGELDRNGGELVRGRVVGQRHSARGQQHHNDPQQGDRAARVVHVAGLPGEHAGDQYFALSGAAVIRNRSGARAVRGRAALDPAVFMPPACPFGAAPRVRPLPGLRRRR
jgi:hypothetical protein